MARIAYVNGAYIAHGDAYVHIDDRGYQFGDAVYEACEIRDKKIIDLDGHLTRLNRSLNEMEMSWPCSRNALEIIIKQVVTRNLVSYGLVYLQISRGVAARNHAFPKKPIAPSLVITARSVNFATYAKKSHTGIRAITVPDIRWQRVDIKTTNLLPNVLAKEEAERQGAQEAIFVDADGNITEGSSTNVWIVDADGNLVTRPADSGILRGITRHTVMKTAEKLQIKVIERKFSTKEALNAREVFVTSATSVVMPVVNINNSDIGDGAPGTVTKNISNYFFNIAQKTAT